MKNQNNVSLNTRPNIFNYATKELSQDAVISYILQWGDDKFKSVDVETHNIGRQFLEAIFDKYENIVKPKNYSIKIKRQENDIDVLCIVNHTYYIIIEDKTNTSHHSNQLNKYYKYVHEKLKIEKENILCIYYKSGEEYNLDSLAGKTEKGVEWEYKLFSKQDILEVLNSSHCDNQILLEYKSYIEELDFLSDYKNLPVDDWNTNSWIVFLRDLKSSGIDLGDKITHGKGSNKGIYFNYKVNEHDKVGFYLRISFDKKQVELKLENEGNIITKELCIKYLESINTLRPDYITIKKAPIKESNKTKVIATIENSVLITKNGFLDFNKTKDFIKLIIKFHEEIIKDIENNYS